MARAHCVGAKGRGKVQSYGAVGALIARGVACSPPRMIRLARAPRRSRGRDGGALSLSDLKLTLVGAPIAVGPSPQRPLPPSAGGEEVLGTRAGLLLGGAIRRLGANVRAKYPAENPKPNTIRNTSARGATMDQVRNATSVVAKFCMKNAVKVIVMMMSAIVRMSSNISIPHSQNCRGPRSRQIAR